MATIRDLAKKVRDDAKKNRESSENKARQERLSNATLSSNTAFTSAAKPQAGLTKPDKVTSGSGDGIKPGSSFDGNISYASIADEVSKLEARQKRLKDERIRAQAEIAEGIGSDTTRYDSVSKELEDVTSRLKELNKIRPTYDSSVAKSLQDAYTSAESKLISSRGSVENAVSELGRIGNSISSMESNLKSLENKFKANPTKELYQQYENAYRNYEKAISEYNSLYAEYKPVADSYASYDDYMTAARSKSSVGDILSKSVWSGIGQINSAVTKTVALPEKLLEKLFPGIATPLSDLADYYAGIQEQFEKNRAETVYNRDFATQKASELASASVAAVPQSLLAALSGGQSVAAQGSTLLSGAANSGLASAVGNSLREMTKNPSYWYSVLQTLGGDYEAAKEKGAGDIAALASAIISSSLNAKVEVGSGLETLPQSVKNGGEDAVTAWVKSALEEGQEEVVQDLISGITAKATYDPNREILSATNEEAIVNPYRMAEEYAMGAGVGGVLGGAMTGINSAIGAAYNVSNRHGMRSQETGKASQANQKMLNTVESHRGIDAQNQTSYTESRTSPAASAEVQQTEAQAQVTQAENPGVNVLDAATTLFTQQGMKLKTAQEKAAIVQKLIAGEEVSVRDINKLNPTSKESQDIFTQLTGVRFPEGKVTQEQLYNLYRSANAVAVESREQQRAQQAAQEAAFQQAAAEQVQAVQERQESPAAQEQHTTDTLTKQMADAGFQANPETQDRIAQAQAELNDAVNGTSTAASRKTGNARNSITLKTGDTLTRDQFKQVMQELYAGKNVNITDGQLDAAFNNFLSTADRGGDVSGLEAMAEYLKNKEENTNGGVEYREGDSGSNLRTGESSADPGRAGSNDAGAEGREEGGERQTEERTSGVLQAEGPETAKAVRSTPGRGEENRNGGSVPSVAEIRDRERAARGRGRDAGYLGAAERTAGDDVLPEVRGELYAGSEKSETAVRDSVRRLAKKRAEEFRKKNYPTERRDVGTGLENNILPEKYWPRSVRKVAEKVRASGGEFYVTVGEVHYLNPKGEHKISDGVTVPDTRVVLVRADSNSRLSGQIAEHELLHWDILLDEKLRDDLKYQVLDSMGNVEIDDLYDYIAGAYAKGKYYGDFEGHFEEYFEEFLCDLNGDVRDRARIPDEKFDEFRSVVLKGVQAWETERNTATKDSSAQGDTREVSSSSNRTRDGPMPLEESDDTPQFTNWDEAFWHFETLAGSNLSFADPPSMSPEMEFGVLDSHGKWYETLGTYSKDADGLAKFNSDVKDFLSTDEISDEELNDLFPPDNGDFADDGYGYNYEDQDADVPGFLSDIYARSQRDASDAVQTNRDGFTKTDTKAFRKWFNDPAGEFTNPDGEPKVFLRGSINMGATKAHSASEAKSKGIYFTTDPSIAQEYASGVSSGANATLMDGIKGDDNLYLKELQRKYFRGWGPAKDYILRNFQANGTGLRLIGLDANGNEVSRIADAETFSLQTNAATEEQYLTEGWFAGDTWRELASFPKTKQGLEDFNYRLGDIIRENKLGIRGYGKYFLTSDNPLVVDANGYDYHGIRSDVLPAELQSGNTYIHIDDIAERAFQNGYDAVIVKNVDDAGGTQTQYIVKDSNQVKSVYNRGTWERNSPDFLFLAENEDHRQKLEDFFKKLEEEYGGGSAEAMFQTFEQLDRARQRAEERAADAEAAQQAAEWATEAAVEAAKMAERERADKKLQKQKDAFQERARQKDAEARLSKAKAVQSARLAEQMNAGRQWAAKLRRQDERATAKAEAMRKSAEERMSQLRAEHQQELDDTRLAERMNAGRKVAEAKRKGRDAVAREKAKREQDHKLASKDAKTAASVLRKYHKADTEKLTNAPVSTLREAYHKPTAKDAVKAAADKLRTAHREFYKAFVNGTQAVDDFSKYQKVDANTSVLLRTAMASGSTVQSIRQDHLVGKDGSVIDERSLEDVVICWDGSGKHRKYNDDKQRILQDYMLHRHNIDRMSFREKALNAVESYEQSYPWLASLEPREFAELVADGNRIAQRYQELIEQFQKAKDKPIFTDSEGKPVTADFSRNLISQYEQQYAWVKEKAEGIYDWWDKFMQEWVVGDSLSAEEYATLRETYPAYVPTYRKDKPGLGKGVSSFGGTVTAKKAVRAATGGTSAVANIEDSFNMLMEKNVSSQRTNMVLRSITDTAMLDDAGDFNGFAVFDWNEAPEILRWGLAAEGFEGALEAGTDQTAAKALSKDDGGVYRVRAWANGERVSAIVDPELYKALDFAFNQKTGWFTKVGQTLTSPMKTFITGINPAFAVRNTIRDNLTAQMNSISVVNSISGIKFEKYYAKAWQEMVSSSENWQHFVALGGTNAGYYNNEGGTYITNLNRQKMQDLNPVNKVGKALGFIGEHTEQVTRFAEYLATIDRLPGGDTYGNRLVGIKNAAEVTVDFSRKGTLGKAFNAWIPYWNPTVQGIDKTVRTFFDQPTVAGKAKVLSRAALTTLPLDVLLFAIYHALDRDDEWEELSDRTKDTYYCIPLPDEHKFLKIPKSRDWGQIIGNPIMRMLQGLDGREDPFENYFEVSIKPNFLWSNPLDAVLLSTQYDLAKNEDFAGRAIVPSNYQKMAKGDQWNSDTSKYAKVIADIGNMFVEEDVLSPMQIDYVINDYFGDFGSMFQRLFSIGGNDKQASAEEQAKMVAEDLLGNWVADNRYSSATVSDYYDMLDKVSQEVAAERVQNPNGYKDTPMYKLNSAFNAKGSASDQITELNAQVRELPDGPEKDEIKGQIVELAREALQMYDAVMSGEITEPKMEMEYSKYGDKVKTALTDLADYSEDYAFLPSDYKPSSYTDPKNKNKEYVLDDAAKAKYRELYDEEYVSVMEAVIKSSKYRSASAEKRAELLEVARDDVAPQVKEEFLKWLAKNYKSTPKKK